MTESLGAGLLFAVLLGSTALGLFADAADAGGNLHRPVRTAHADTLAARRGFGWLALDAVLSDLMFWLAVVFANFGLSAPRNLLSYVTITLGGVAIASAIYVIVDLDQPFGGMFSMSSEPLRDALTQLGR